MDNFYVKDGEVKAGSTLAEYGITNYTAAGWMPAVIMKPIYNKYAEVLVLDRIEGANVIYKAVPCENTIVNLPIEISIRDFKLALCVLGCYADIESKALNHSNYKVKIDWFHTGIVTRNSSLCELFDTIEEIDEVFKTADLIKDKYIEIVNY